MSSLPEHRLYFAGAYRPAKSGKTAIDHYTQPKSVYVELGDAEAPY